MNNEQQLHSTTSWNALVRILTKFKGDFSLILVCCNHESLRQKIIQKLQTECPVEIQTLVLEPEVKTLYSTILQHLTPTPPAALMVLGLEKVKNLEQLLKATNQIREEFRNLKFPVILWVTDEILQALIRTAQDFYSWATTLSFESTNPEIIQFIEDTTNQISEKVLQQGVGVFLNNVALHLEQGSPLRTELESSRKELQKRGVNLDLELEASLEFVLGLVADHATIAAFNHYERSLNLWQQTSNWVRRALVLFYLGFWWRTQAVFNRSRSFEFCEKAEDFYRQSIHLFKQSNRLDLAAKFINAWGEVLLYLGRWDTLEQVAQEALELHQTYLNLFRQGRAYHFLAEVLMQKKDWIIAEQAIQNSLKLLKENLEQRNPVEHLTTSVYLDWERYYHQGWYLLSLAKIQIGLGKIEDSIKTLEKAKSQTKPQYDPELYISILQKLQESFYQKTQYLKAFEVKQKRREIEQKFGFRAFIGAGRLSQSETITNPSLPSLEYRKNINIEITASGRVHHVNSLVERMSRTDQKITVIYGQSGVGKSSLLQAGLIPKLQRELIETRKVLPILQQVYTNWVQELGRTLAKTLEDYQNSEIESSALNSIETILEQVEIQTQRNWLVVLIFDQFEEFFFVCRESQQRQQFYQFLKAFLEKPYIKLIISIREDYLHHLLECNRQGYLEIINNNVLEKNVIYHLGNFSLDEAKAVIQALTKKTQFNLEEQLIEELVKDLAEESGEVRPIELQVVGSQLQAQKITTLERYRKEGPKRKLVERYLEEVIKDCGEENKHLAELVLFLLTDDNNTRPLKTRMDLAKELKELADYLETDEQSLDTILQIFVHSGLVCIVPELPANRYQLVHDYLVSFIRQQRSAELFSELEKEREKRQKAEATLNHVLQQQLQDAKVQSRVQKQQLIFSRVLSFLIAVLAVVAVFQWKNADNQRRRAESQTRQITLAKLNSQYLAHLLNNEEVYALLSVLKAGLKLQTYPLQSDLEKETVSKLWGTVNFIQGTKGLEREIKHSTSVLSIAFSPNNQIIASASGDNIVRLWNRTGTLINTLKSHQDTVWFVTFNPKKPLIATASKDKTIKLWNLQGQLIKTLSGHKDEVKWVSFSPDGEYLVSASKDKTVKLWRSNGEFIKTLGNHESSVLSVTFHPQNPVIASSSEDGMIKIWNLQGELLETIKAHNQPVWSINFSPDGAMLASASDDKTVKLWNRNYKLFKILRGHQEAVNSVSFSQNGRYIATGGTDKTIRLWTREGIFISTWQAHNKAVNQLAFSSDHKTLISASLDQTIRLWNLSVSPQVFKPKNEKIFSLSFSPNSQWIVSPGRNLKAKEQTLFIWNPDTFQFQSAIPKAHGDTVNNVSWSSQGQLMASASQDKTVKVWNQTGVLQATLPHSEAVWTVTFNPKTDKILATATNKTIYIWDLKTKRSHRFIAHDDQINDLIFSPYGQTIVSASQDKTLKLWKLDGTLIQTLTRGGRPFSSISFSRDGQLLVAASGDGLIKLWKHENGTWKEIDNTIGIGEHRGTIYDLSFSPNNQIFASASKDGTVKLWDRNGNLVTTLRLGEEPILSVSFSPYGKKLVAIHQAEKPEQANWVSVWDLELENLSFGQTDVNHLLKRACEQIQGYLENNERIDPQDQQLCDNLSVNRQPSTVNRQQSDQHD